jgi:hypothetical protein
MASSKEGKLGIIESPFNINLWTLLFQRREMMTIQTHTHTSIIIGESIVTNILI